jgi:ABC-type lipoprotein export system ATPase subunit
MPPTRTDTTTTPVAAAAARGAARGEALLRARGVRRSFQMGESVIQILKGVDFDLRAGEFVAVEGRSGSGKSTLLHILGGLDGMDGGTLEFAGESYGYPVDPRRGPLTRSLLNAPVILLASLASVVIPILAAPTIAAGLLISAGIVGFWIALFVTWLAVRYVRERPITRLRNRQFGFVFQFYHLLPELNVLENTLLAAMVERSWLGFQSHRHSIVERATRILTDTGLAHRLKHRPSQLSGGERQRVAIARALMNEPRVLFADEPTGNLDVDTGRQIMDLLEKLHRDKGQTIVMVTHDRALAREADRVLVLKDGKLEKAE